MDIGKNVRMLESGKADALDIILSGLFAENKTEEMLDIYARARWCSGIYRGFKTEAHLGVGLGALADTEKII